MISSSSASTTRQAVQRPRPWEIALCRRCVSCSSCTIPKWTCSRALTCSLRRRRVRLRGIELANGRRYDAFSARQQRHHAQHAVRKQRHTELQRECKPSGTGSRSSRAGAFRRISLQLCLRPRRLRLVGVGDVASSRSRPASSIFVHHPSGHFVHRFMLCMYIFLSSRAPLDPGKTDPFVVS